MRKMWAPRSNAISLLFQTVLLLSPLILIFSQTVAAQQAVRDQYLPMTPPSGIATQTGGDSPLTANAGMRIEFLNRARIRVYFNNSGALIFGQGSQFHGNSTAIGVFAGEYIRGRHNGTSYNDRNSQAHIFVRDLQGTDATNNLADRWDVLTGEEIRDMLQDANMRLSLAASDINGGSLPCQSGFERVGVVEYNGSVGWRCGHNVNNSSHEIRGLSSVLSGSIQNANITHAASSDAETLRVVFPDNDERDDSFFYCETTKSYHLRECGNARNGYSIDLQPESLQGSGSVLATVESSSGSPSFRIRVAQAQNTTAGGGADSGVNAGEDVSCEANGGPFGWILCGLFTGLVNALETFGRFVQERLDVTIQSEDTIREAWNNVRSIANILFVMAFLFVIISQALVGRF